MFNEIIALVGLSDVAELTGLSRQAITMLKDGLRGGGISLALFSGSRDSRHYGIGQMSQTGSKKMAVLKEMQNLPPMPVF